MPSNRPSLQDRIRNRQHNEFVGRDDQVSLFRRNLALPIDERIYIFNVFGQGGIGKSTLLRRFREIAGGVNALTALTNDDQTDVLAAMEQLAADLARQGHELRAFAERCRTYHQRHQELESDPDAPTGFSALVTRTLVKGGLALAKSVPGGSLVDLVDDDAVASKAGEWADYVARKLRHNTDEISLVRDPVAELTPLWLADLSKLGDKSQIILFFDTYERTSSFLDEWLRDLLYGAYGPLPDTTQLVIAGRDELDRNRWADYESVIARLSLEPFSEEEARDFLTRKGIVDERVIEVILHLSGRLPLLVATLAAEHPDDPAKVGDPSGTAVERFLKWTEDSILRRAAVDAALPRRFNSDIIALLVEDKHVDNVFEWLRRMPFVEQRTDGWVYHAVAREQMLRYKRRESRQSWAGIQARLAEHYERQADQLHLEDPEQWSSTTWRSFTSEALYHRLCQSPHKHVSNTLNAFVECRNATNLASTEQFIEPFAFAAEALDDDGLRSWTYDLQRLIDADRASSEVTCIELWDKIANCAQLTTTNKAIALTFKGFSRRLVERNHDIIAEISHALDLYPFYAPAFALRGATYRDLKQYEKALVDLSRAIEINPHYAWALARRGATNRDLNRYEDALADLSRAIDINPQHTWAWALRGGTYRIVLRYKEALADLSRAIELDSQYVWAIRERASVYRALARYEEALADLSRAIELDPRYGPAIARRGATYRALARYEDALADFSRLADLTFESDWSLYQHALIYLLTNNQVAAQIAFTNAIQLARQKYQQTPGDWNNACNLALY